MDSRGKEDQIIINTTKGKKKGKRVKMEVKFEQKRRKANKIRIKLQENLAGKFIRGERDK